MTETVTLTTFAPARGRVLNVYLREKGGMTIYMMGRREQFGLFVPKGLCTPEFRPQAGDDIEFTFDVGQYGISALAVSVVPTTAGAQHGAPATAAVAGGGAADESKEAAAASGARK